ncbi:MAG: bacteriocin [Pseudomonadales bacterium]|nr:bacteriocin [Pseudomonadales bacterium]
METRTPVTMRELTDNELQHVSGGYNQFGKTCQGSVFPQDALRYIYSPTSNLDQSLSGLNVQKQFLQDAMFSS